MPRPKPESAVIIRYTNYRGETADRRIIPIRIRYGSTKWHPEPQWLLEAFDIDRDAGRAFALKDVVEWKGELACLPSVQHARSA
jgi:predicted DNA-binding transcriptional regulator YafY